MDEIFDFLNKTYEAGHSVLGGTGRIIGYANDGYELEGVLSLNDEEFSFLVSDSDVEKDTAHYTLTLTHNDQTATYSHLPADQIIAIFKQGDLPFFQET